VSNKRYTIINHIRLHGYLLFTAQQYSTPTFNTYTAWLKGSGSTGGGFTLAAVFIVTVTWATQYVETCP